MRKVSILVGALIVFVATVGTVFAATNRNFTVPLSGAHEVPVRDTQARGVAILRLNPDGTELSYKLNVANIENVRQAHIHLGPEDDNGPVVAFLYGPVPPAGGRVSGRLSEGTITAANLVGPLAGHPLSDLIAAMNAGQAYVNVHTDNGTPPPDEGPGDFPGGEVRGQVK